MLSHIHLPPAPPPHINTKSLEILSRSPDTPDYRRYESECLNTRKIAIGKIFKPSWLRAIRRYIRSKRSIDALNFYLRGYWQVRGEECEGVKGTMPVDLE